MPTWGPEFDGQLFECSSRTAAWHPSWIISVMGHVTAGKGWVHPYIFKEGGQPKSQWKINTSWYSLGENTQQNETEEKHTPGGAHWRSSPSCGPGKSISPVRKCLYYVQEVDKVYWVPLMGRKVSKVRLLWFMTSGGSQSTNWAAPFLSVGLWILWAECHVTQMIVQIIIIIMPSITPLEVPPLSYFRRDEDYLTPVLCPPGMSHGEQSGSADPRFMWPHSSVDPSPNSKRAFISFDSSDEIFEREHVGTVAAGEASRPAYFERSK